MSQALAWQTTSRSRGRVNMERSQKVFGSGANPSERKNRSPYCTIPTGSMLRVFKMLVRS